MSAKIFDAYLFKGTVIELLPVLQKMRKDVFEFAAQKFGKCLKPEAAVGGNFVKQMEVIEKCLTYPLKHGLNFSSSAVVYFDKEIVDSGHLIIQFFGIDGAFNNIELVDLKLLKDFHYQNCTDKPDEISDEEWDYREKVWGRIFKSSWAPARAGLTYEFCSKSDAIDIALMARDFRRKSDEEANKTSSEANNS